MPWKTTLKRAQRDKREGKAPTTQAGEFVREEIEHVRRGKHGARSPQQAIAIGLSEARRAGIPLRPPRKGETSERTRRSAERAYEVGQEERASRSRSRKRGAAVERALKREPRSTASRSALSRASRAGWAKRRRSGARRAPASSAARTTRRKSGGRSRTRRRR